MLKYIRDELVSMTDKGNYQTFTSSLIPGCNNIIGVRQPALKKYAKQLVKENEDFRKLLTEPDLYYEETLLRGYIIGMGTAKEKDFDNLFRLLIIGLLMMDFVWNSELWINTDRNFCRFWKNVYCRKMNLRQELDL